MFQLTHMTWLSKHVMHDKNGKNRMWNSGDNSNENFQWEIILIPPHIDFFLQRKKSRKRYITPTLTTDVKRSRYYRLLLWRLKGLPWIWMRAPLSRGWRPHMGILRCLCCFQDEGVAAPGTWGGAVSPLGDVALPSQPARLCKCAVLSGELCYSWNAGLYLWKISWANCWICVRL